MPDDSKSPSRLLYWLFEPMVQIMASDFRHNPIGQINLLLIKGRGLIPKYGQHRVNIRTLLIGLLLGIQLLTSGCNGGEGIITIDGTVCDDKGGAIDGARVTLKPAPNSGYKDKPREQITDSSGKFLLTVAFSPGFPPKDIEYILSIKREGFQKYERTTTTDLSDLQIKLHPVKDGRR